MPEEGKPILEALTSLLESKGVSPDWARVLAEVAEIETGTDPAKLGMPRSDALLVAAILSMKGETALARRVEEAYGLNPREVSALTNVLRGGSKVGEILSLLSSGNVIEAARLLDSEAIEEILALEDAGLVRGGRALLKSLAASLAYDYVANHDRGAWRALELLRRYLPESVRAAVLASRAVETGSTELAREAIELDPLVAIQILARDSRFSGLVSDVLKRFGVKIPSPAEIERAVLESLASAEARAVAEAIREGRLVEAPNVSVEISVGGTTISVSLPSLARFYYHVKRAEREFEAGNTERGIEEIERAVESCPSLARALGLESYLARLKDFYALALVSEALNSLPDRSKALSLLSKAEEFATSPGVKRIVSVAKDVLEGRASASEVVSIV